MISLSIIIYYVKINIANLVSVQGNMTGERLTGKESGEIFIALTVIDHAAGATYGQAQSTLEMAALSRLISANVWQKRDSLGAKVPADWAMGAPHARNTVLRLTSRNL
jgi:hypothetical protein